MLAPALDLSNDSPKASATRLRTTRVLIVSDHPTESREVATSLRKLDLDVQLCLFDGITLSAIPNNAPDAVLCHLTDYVGHASKLAKVIRSHYKERQMPIIGAMSRPSPIVSEGFDSTLFAPMHPSQIANRVNAMVRLGVMEGEIERRLATLEESFGQIPKIGDFSPDRKFRVLFIGKASPSFMIIINALQDKGVDVIAAFTSFSAFDYLHGKPFDAVVMNALEHSEPAFSISETMRRNSKLYHTPTLFLVNGKKFKQHDAAYEKGARDIIDVNADADEISSRILELANYHRIHEQLKLDFRSLAVDAASDETGTAYSQAFMRAHFPRMIRDAEKSNLPTTLLALRLIPHSVDGITTESLTAALTQTSDLLVNLVRMQDVVCHWETGVFVLGFFDTNKAEAEIILKRITALLECTTYESGPDSRSGLNISAETIIYEIEPNCPRKNSHLDALVANLFQEPDET